MQIQSVSCASLGIVMGGLSLLSQAAIANPIVLDGSTQTQISGSVDCSADCVITGSDRLGGNLFHSFDRFNISEAVTVTFEGDGLGNILTRITGGEASDIEGRLRVAGEANFFLLNPNGIVFHPSSALELGGSFVASTGSSLQFEDGTTLLATASAPPLLTVSTPVGLGFGAAPGRIQVLGAQLPGPAEAVIPGQTFALIGGEIEVLGSQLVAPDGSILLESAAAGEFVPLLSGPNGFELSLEQEGLGGNIQIEQSQLTTRGFDGGGKIYLKGKDVRLTGSSLQNDSSPFATRDSNGIKLQGQEEVSLIGTQVTTETNSINQGGAIDLEGRGIVIAGTTDPAAPSPTIISSRAQADGSGGGITLLAKQVDIQDFSLLTTTAAGSGDAGDISVDAQDFSLSGSRLFSTTFSSGKAGSLNLNVANQATLEGIVPFIGIPSGLFTDIVGESAQSESAGGDILVRVGAGQSGIGQLLLQDGAQVAAITLGSANAGNVTVSASDITLTGNVDSAQAGRVLRSGIFSETQPGAFGNGSSIQILTETFLVRDGAQVSSTTFSAGQAGQIEINASESIEIEGDVITTGVSAQVEPSALGSGGVVILRAPLLSITEGGIISASTVGEGAGGAIVVDVNQLNVESGAQLRVSSSGEAPAGQLTITATEFVNLAGSSTQEQSSSGLFSSTGSEAEGIGDQPGGSIVLQTQDLSVTNGARISAASFNAGSGGLLDLDIAGQARFSGESDDGQFSSGLFVSGFGTGPAGEIQLSAGSVFLNQAAKIQAETASNDGGNIFVRAQDNLLLRRGSSISATAGTVSGQGNGGNLTIQTPFLVGVPLEDTDIIANAFEGSGGNIRISTQLLLGLEQRPAIPGNGTNDIDASSETGTDGTIAVNQVLDDNSVVPVEISAEPTDVTELIGNACNDSLKFGGRFVITGRGGLPLTPSDSVGLWMPFLDSDSADSVASAPFLSSTVQSDDPSRIDLQAELEAQGWQRTVSGRVQLLAGNGRSRPERRFVGC